MMRQCYALAVGFIRQSLADAKEAAEVKAIFSFHMILPLSFATCYFMFISIDFGVALSSKTRRSHPMASSGRLRVHP